MLPYDSVITSFFALNKYLVGWFCILCTVSWSKFYIRPFFRFWQKQAPCPTILKD